MAIVSGCEGEKSDYIFKYIHEQQVNDHDCDDFQH